LEFIAPFQHKYGYIRDDKRTIKEERKKKQDENIYVRILLCRAAM